MLKNSYTKKNLSWYYTLFNFGKTSKQAKRNRRLGQHIIRSKQKMDLYKLINMLE